MADESELIKLREELKQIQDATRRSRRRGAFWVVVLLLLFSIWMFYAFVQQVTAEKIAEEVLRQKDIADNARIDAEQNAEQARRAESMAMEVQKQAVAAMREAEERLAKCKEKK